MTPARRARIQALIETFPVRRSDFPKLTVTQMDKLSTLIKREGR